MKKIFMFSVLALAATGVFANDPAEVSEKYSRYFMKLLQRWAGKLAGK